MTADKIPLRVSCVALLREIRKLKRKNWSVEFANVPRTANMCVDYMANVGVSSGGGRVSWVAPGHKSTMLLLHDAT